MNKSVEHYIDRAETGLAIYRAIHNAEFTQAEISRIMAVPPCMVSRWATGRHLPDMDSLAHLADIVGVSVDSLLIRRKRK